MGLACVWVTRAAIKIRNPHEVLGIMSPMQLVHWVTVLYISLVLGRGGTWVGEGGLLDFILLLVQSFLFFTLPGIDCPVGNRSVLTESMGVILLECGLPRGSSFITDELRTGVGRVTSVLTSSRLAEGISALVTGLDGFF